MGRRSNSYGSYSKKKWKANKKKDLQKARAVLRELNNQDGCRMHQDLSGLSSSSSLAKKVDTRGNEKENSNSMEKTATSKKRKRDGQVSKVIFKEPEKEPASGNVLIAELTNKERHENIPEIEPNSNDGLTEPESTEQSENTPEIEPDSNDGLTEPESTEQSENTGNGIKIEGNRIISMEYFLSELIKIGQHNDRFGCSLNCLKIIKEKQNGLLSTFHLECSMCKSKFKLNNIEERADTLNLNEGAVSGAIITGIGHSNLNEINASMDLPAMPLHTYSKCHDNVAEMWKIAAEESMQAAAKEEADAARLRGDVTEQNVPVVPVEADCCWSKRSYKTNYSALSGVAAIIGHHSGKVLHIGVKNKYCVICARANKSDHDPPLHNCTKNHTGPSTSMEPAIIVEGFQCSVEKRGLIYNPLIGDGDASTYKKIMESRPYPGIPIQKIECTNHLLRNYNGKNIALQKDTSVPLCERKLLTQDRITRLRKAVRAAVRYRSAENCTESEKIKNLQKDIINSPKHVLGEHSECHSYFCNDSRKSETNYTTAATTLMLKLQRNASQLAFQSRSLLKKFTTNRAEQFNSIVAKTVGGKRVNFSLKDSYAVRCYAAVVSFNTGKPQTSLYKSACKSSPVKAIKKLEEKRLLRNQKRKPRKINFAPRPTAANVDYGIACQKPDMAPAEFEEAKKIFLENLEKQAESRYEIERETVLQAESALWIELRRCILTASKFAKICKRRSNLNSAPLVKALLYSKSLDHVPAISHGKKNEAKALKQLAVQENIVVEKCGLFIHRYHCYLGASPDGLFGDDGLIEIKCPISCYGMDSDTAIDQKVLKCFKKENGTVVFNKKHDWYYQIQGQLQIANKNVCLFGVWTGPEFPMKIVKILRDNRFWTDEMLPKLEKYYNACILPEIVDSRRARSMPLRDIVL